MSIDDDTLLDALENESNSSIIKLTSNKINQHKNDVLQSLQLDRDKLKKYHKKLKHYRYCSDVNDFQPGQYLRWINLKDPDNIKLTNGAFLIDIIFEKNKLDILQLYFSDSKGVNLNNKLIINKKKFSKNKKYIEGGLKIFNKNIFKKKFLSTKYFKIEDFIKYNNKKLNVRYFIIKDRPYSIDTWKRIQRTKNFLKKKNL